MSHVSSIVELSKCRTPMTSRARTRMPRPTVYAALDSLRHPLKIAFAAGAARIVQRVVLVPQATDDLCLSRLGDVLLGSCRFGGTVHLIAARQVPLVAAAGFNEELNEVGGILWRFRPPAD